VRVTFGLAEAFAVRGRWHPLCSRGGRGSRWHPAIEITANINIRPSSSRWQTPVHVTSAIAATLAVRGRGRLPSGRCASQSPHRPTFAVDHLRRPIGLLRRSCACRRRLFDSPGFIRRDACAHLPRPIGVIWRMPIGRGRSLITIEIDAVVRGMHATVAAEGRMRRGTPKKLQPRTANERGLLEFPPPFQTNSAEMELPGVTCVTSRLIHGFGTLRVH
jgi:hypothetical protein